MTLLSFLIAIAPLLALVTLLLNRRYPGETMIERLRTLVDSAMEPAAGAPEGSGCLPGFEFTARGGRLLACSLAGRGPPFRV